MYDVGGNISPRHAPICAECKYRIVSSRGGADSSFY